MPADQIVGLLNAPIALVKKLRPPKMLRGGAKRALKLLRVESRLISLVHDLLEVLQHQALRSVAIRSIRNAGRSIQSLLVRPFSGTTRKGPITLAPPKTPIGRARKAKRSWIES